MQQVNDLARGDRRIPRSAQRADYKDLRSDGASPGVTPQVLNVFNQEMLYLRRTRRIADIEIVGPEGRRGSARQAINATLLALAGMLVYIWFRFEWIYGVGAVMACFTTRSSPSGYFLCLNKEITLTVIAALLTWSVTR